MLSDELIIENVNIGYDTLFNRKLGENSSLKLLNKHFSTSFMNILSEKNSREGIF